MFVMAAIMSILFLGGWDDPFGLISRWNASVPRETLSMELIAVNAAAFGMFLFKTIVLIFVQMWVRWTLPRPRIDQVLHACLKVLLPMSLALLLGSAVWELLVTAGSLTERITQVALLVLGIGFVGLILLMLAHAFVEGRRSQQRLGA
jgi:NADH-quinone oxidoreductase subunit H